jgi:hypothetical protein
MFDTLLQYFTAPLPRFKQEDEYFLAYSSDTLVIIENNRIVEEIIVGKDNNATLCSTNNLDEFLDAILILKKRLQP